MKDLKGQSSAVFRLLIGMIVGVTIFAIIYSLIMQTDASKGYLENEIFYKKIEMAIKNPTSQEYIIDKVEVKKNTSVNKYSLSYKTGLGESCFSFAVADPDRKDVQAIGSTGLSFKKDVTLDFGVKCITNQQDCKIFCDITIK